MGAIVEAAELAFAYPRGPEILSGVGLSLDAGDICTILGPNGAGKTTLLNLLGGYLIPRRGCVRLCGDDIQMLDPRVRAMRLGFVPQLQTDAVDLEVRDYMVLGTAMRIGLFSIPHEHEYEKAEHVMSEFGIEHLCGKSMANLSGGERQQVEIARTLVQDADVILMDEPTNHLDYGNQVKVLATIKRLSRENGKTIVLTTHMPDHAILLGGKTAIMDGRGGLDVGPAEQMVDEKRLQEIYQTDVHLVYVEELHRLACLTGSIK